ncbi:MAG: DUF2207 domain-containing protein [Acidobacteriota bacterium]|nr:DUF2207 domain-containing protein [Acidobacteriota bacterium]
MLRARCLVLVLGVVLGAATVRAAKEHVAERYDVDAAVRADGSLVIEEEIAFRFTGGEYTYVNREIPAENTDGVEVLGAAMNGRELAWGDEEGQLEVDYRRRAVRVRWHFAPTRDHTHVFTLRYRLVGVVRNTAGEDWFAWQPFPSRFDYAIDTGTVRVSWMPGARLRRQAHTEGPVTSVSPSETGFVATVANYRQRDDDVVLTARFEPGAFTSPEPQWQRDAQHADQMSTSFFAAAGMITAATILALLLFFLKHRRDRSGSLGAGQSVSTRPDALAPALAGSIVHGRVSVTSPQLLAVVFDLAGRGAITIEEQPASGMMKTPRFIVRRGRPIALAPHEQFVLDDLFKKESAPRLDQTLRAMHARLGKFGKAVKAELAAEGLIDAERADAAKAMMISAAVVMVFAAGVGTVIAALNMRLGDASLLVPGAFLWSGVMLLIVGAAFSTLSARGWSAAARWKAYAQHLKEQARDSRLPSTPDEMSRMLPFATALGIGPAWQKAMKKMPDAAVPPWLATLGEGGRHAAYTALLVSTGSAGSSGAAGGGAAGGGSSSAG